MHMSHLEDTAKPSSQVLAQFMLLPAVHEGFHPVFLGNKSDKLSSTKISSISIMNYLLLCNSPYNYLLFCV